MYLTSLPKDVASAKKSLISVQQVVGIPQPQRDEYVQKFQAHGRVLDEFRRSLEDIQASGAPEVADLRSAKAAVINLRQDVKAWEEIVKLYEAPCNGA